MGVHAGQWQAQDGAHALAEAAGVSVLVGASATAVEVESAPAAPAAGAAAAPPLDPAETVALIKQLPATYEQVGPKTDTGITTKWTHIAITNA